jgi:hypothetical protein
LVMVCSVIGWTTPFASWTTSYWLTSYGLFRVMVVGLNASQWSVSPLPNTWYSICSDWTGTFLLAPVMCERDIISRKVSIIHSVVLTNDVEFSGIGGRGQVLLLCVHPLSLILGYGAMWPWW